MSSSKIYLNVPYAEKDAAKAVGAKWDAANKKWYAPASVDISLFGKWHDLALAVAPSKKPGGKQATPPTGKTGSPGVFTQPTIKDFVAYAGDAPPWE
jgi:hypothetical protein